MSTAIKKLDAEIARLQAEIVNVERAPATIAERYAEAHAELRDAERLYRAHGHKVSAPHPAETAHLQQQAVIGACMVVGADKLLQAERQRIEAQGEGLTAADKARRLDQVRRAVLQLAARREIAVRAIEGAEFMPRAVHPELAIYKRAAVERRRSSDHKPPPKGKAKGASRAIEGEGQSGTGAAHKRRGTA